MSEKRGQRGFVKVGDWAANTSLHLIPGSENMPAVHQATEQKRVVSAQARHHFNSVRQIDTLARIGEDKDPDMGFMTRMLTLCSLPRTDPRDRLQYKRTNGPYKLIMIAGGDNKLPFGNLPRLLLAWVCTEAVQTQNPKLNLGSSLAAFMQRLGISSDSGGSRGDRTRLKDQIDRLFNAHIDLIYEDGDVKASTGGRLASNTVLWWDYHNPDQQTRWKSWIQLSDELFQEIIAHPIPIDIKILTAMRRSSLGFDLYLWLSYKTFSLFSQSKKPDRLSWERLYRQFGVDPGKVDDPYVIQNFRKDVLRELTKLKLAWPAFNYATPKGCLEIRACPPTIAPKRLLL
jgi:hypothetical protein